MNKKLKSLVMVALALSVTSSVFVGCGKKTEEPAASKEISTEIKVDNSAEAGKTFKAEKPLKITMLFNDMASYPYKQDWLIWSEITKRTNVTLDVTVVPSSDYEQKRSLLISTGDAPLIIPKTYPGSETQFIPSGAILPVSDYVSQMPNYTKKVKDWSLQGDLKTILQGDGKYYVLPGLHEKPKYDYSFALRKDILDKEGLKLPTSYDEMYDVLKKLKAKYPDIYPYSDRWKVDGVLNFVAPTFGVSAGWGAGGGINYDDKTDKFFFGPTTDDYKAMVTYYNKLIKEGLMDPESFVQSDDQALQKFVTGKSFVIGTNTQETVKYNTNLETNLGKGNFEVAQIATPAGPKGDVVYSSRLENGVMLSSKVKDNPNSKDIIKFVDWLWYSDEGQELSKWGVEGTTYTKTNGVRQFATDVTYNGINPTGTKALNKDFGFSSGVFAYGGSQDLKTSMMSKAESDFQKLMSSKKLLPIAPPILYTTDEREQGNMITTPLMDYVKSMTLKFMLGSEPLTNWDKYVADCKAKGSDKVVDLANSVYTKTKDKLK
jgi:putative aldouronate transport system substrate-binding protein